MNQKTETNLSRSKMSLLINLSINIIQRQIYSKLVDILYHFSSVLALFTDDTEISFRHSDIKTQLLFNLSSQYSFKFSTKQTS